jgi:murein L,D-transpeptidase YcbB/YkuD
VTADYSDTYGTQPVLWPRILKPGDRKPCVPALRGFLYALGYMGRDDLTNPAFDGPLEVAVRWFQADSGLTVDGRVGPRTRHHLSEGLKEALQ